MWSMLGWCIVTLASVTLKASVRFPPLRRMYQGGTCKGCDTVCLFEFIANILTTISYTSKCE